MYEKFEVQGTTLPSQPFSILEWSNQYSYNVPIAIHLATLLTVMYVAMKQYRYYQ